MTISKNEIFDALKHIVLMRSIEKGRSLVTDDAETIALVLLIELERRIIGLSSTKA